MNLRLPAGYVEGKAAQAQAEARESFWAFRKNLRYGTMLSGWWVELVAVELQQFYEDFAAGRRPKLALTAPPQHGKSGTAIDFTAWSSGIGLRALPEVRLEQLPRMADFALWATACETTFGPAGGFLQTYKANRRAAIEDVVEADPVAARIRDIMAERTMWSGNASDLLRVAA
jgi:hypothetical protein